MDVDPDPCSNLSWANQVDAAVTNQSSTNVLTSHVISMPPPALTYLFHVDPTPLVILYNFDQPTDPTLWDGNFGAMFIFGTKEFFAQDVANIV